MAVGRSERFISIIRSPYLCSLLSMSSPDAATPLFLRLNPHAAVELGWCSTVDNGGVCVCYCFLSGIWCVNVTETGRHLGGSVLLVYKVLVISASGIHLTFA